MHWLTMDTPPWLSLRSGSSWHYKIWNIIFFATYVLASWMEMSRSSSPTVATSGAVHAPWGWDTSATQNTQAFVSHARALLPFAACVRSTEAGICRMRSPVIWFDVMQWLNPTWIKAFCLLRCTNVIVHQNQQVHSSFGSWSFKT